MRDLSSETYAALQARALVARDFIWFIVKDRVTGNPVTDGYWSDVGEVSAPVIDPNTGGVVTRGFHGAAGLIQISDIPLVSNITVQTVQVRLSQVSDRIRDLVHGYECKQGQVQIWRGLFSPDTRLIVSPATPRFVGFIDNIEITTPAENDDGSVMLTCVSHTQEMTRYNPDTRSDASQRLRSGPDDFYKDTTVVGGWQHFWGRKSGVVASSGPDTTGWKPTGSL